MPTAIKHLSEHRGWVWMALQLFFQLVFTTWVQYRARGHERLAGYRGMLFVMNHQSFLDPVLVGLPIKRPISYLARDSLFRAPVVGWVLRHTYVLPINRESASAGALRGMIEQLRAGYWVGVFPEGTRSHDGKLGPIKPGFLAILRRAEVPICPVAIAGAGQALGRGAWFLGKSKIRVVFGDPILADEVAALMAAGEDNFLDMVRRQLDSCYQEAESWRQGR